MYFGILAYRSEAEPSPHILTKKEVTVGGRKTIYLLKEHRLCYYGIQALIY